MEKYPRTTISNNQKEDINSVGAIIIPGGDLARVNHLASLLPVDVPIILTGSHYILNELPSQPESHVAKQHLLWMSNSVSKPSFYSKAGSYFSIDDKNIILEDKSVDHLSAFYFAKNNIEQVLSGSKNKTLGIIVDPSHMRTCANCANWTLDDSINFIGFNTDLAESLFSDIYSKVLTGAWAIDIKNSYGVLNSEKVKHYIEHNHPYFGSDKNISAYGLLVAAAKFVKPILEVSNRLLGK